MQGANAAPSRRHSNEATPEPPASLPEKAKLAEALLLSAGGSESIVVLGAAVSIDPAERSRALVDVAGGVDRPHLE